MIKNELTMKALKIVLFTTVLAAIAYFVYQSIGCCSLPEALRFDCECAPQVSIPDAGEPNKIYIDQVREQINKLELDSRNQFEKTTYLIIQKQINSHAEEGRITQSDLEILDAELLRTYVKGFYRFSKSVFNGSEWKNSDIQHIRKEAAEILANQNLKTGPVRKEIEEVAEVIKSYDKAHDVIVQALAFKMDVKLNQSFSSNGEAERILKAAKFYRHYDYIQNCKHLTQGLNDVPKILYNSHYDYAQLKINRFGTTYKEYLSQPLFDRCVYKPLKLEIDSFYTKNSFPDTYDRYKDLERNLTERNRKAFEYFKDTPDSVLVATARYKTHCP